MNPEQFLNRLKASVSAMSGKQLGTLAVAFVAVVGLVIGSSYYLNLPTYGVLFSDMDPESASSVVTKLKTQKVQYVLDEGGRTVRVPANRVDELRLQFASDGMPGSGHVGFELFDRTAFGVTDFLEHVNYRRALEGELARTISTIGEVAGARVHIAMPQPSLFTGRDQPTKASVILKLRNNRPLQPSTVNAITGLVSASVESLRPEAVVIIDNYGRPLTKSDADGENTETATLERQQRIERDLTTRVVTLLEPIVGSGHVRVNVSAKLNSNTEEKTEERFDTNPVLRSSELKTASNGTTSPGQIVAGPGAPAQGVAGTASNLPNSPNNPAPQMAAVAVAGASTTSSQSSDIKNYEISKVVTRSVTPKGDITKLSVAVLLDDAHQAAAGQNGQPAAATVKPRTAEDIQKIQGLVSAAVGLDSERGDQLTVENITFEETPIEETLPAPGAWQKYGPQVFEALRMLGIVAVGFFAIFGIIRPLMKNATSAAAAPAIKGSAVPKALAAVAAGGAQVRTVQDLEAEMDAQLMSGEAMKMPVLTRRMAALSQKEPENAARLLRTWLNED